MDLNIDSAFNHRVITPFTQAGRTYFLMFSTLGSVGPFYVATSQVQVEQSMFVFGDILRKEDNLQVGTLLYTTAKTQCLGTYVIAYSGQFKASLATSIPKDFDMDLVLKTPHLQVYNRRNRATLVVSPNLKQSIRSNLEV